METPRIDGASKRADRPVDLGKYTLLAHLATGGMGQVYVAQMSGAAGFEKQVVVKRLLPHLLQDEQVVKMFLDEARLTARLSHPNICQVIELVQVEGEYYLVMEYLEGEPLSRVCSRARGLDLRIAAGIVSQACDGLAHAHNFSDPTLKVDGIIHRDVSPHNLMLTTSGLVKLLDFGVAKLHREGSQTVTGSAKGKYAYMSPEQLQCEPLDPRCDLFALGIVLFELIAGVRLFRRKSELASMQAIVNGDRPRLSDVRPDVPKQLDAVVEKALSVRRASRFDSARSFAKALAEAMIPRGGVATYGELAQFLLDQHGADIDAQRVRIRNAVARLDDEDEPTLPAAPAGGDETTVASSRRRIVLPLQAPMPTETAINTDSLVLPPIARSVAAMGTEQAAAREIRNTDTVESPVLAQSMVGLKSARADTVEGPPPAPAARAGEIDTEEPGIEDGEEEAASVDINIDSVMTALPVAPVTEPDESPEPEPDGDSLSGTGRLIPPETMYSLELPKPRLPWRWGLVILATAAAIAFLIWRKQDTSGHKPSYPTDTSARAGSSASPEKNPPRRVEPKRAGTAKNAGAEDQAVGATADKKTDDDDDATDKTVADDAAADKKAADDVTDKTVADDRADETDDEDTSAKKVADDTPARTNDEDTSAKKAADENKNTAVDGRKPTGKRKTNKTRSRKSKRTRTAAAQGEKGFFTVDASPYATIYVGKRKLGVTPLIRVPLAAGKHRVRAVSSKGGTKRLGIRIDPGKTTKKRIVF